MPREVIDLYTRYEKNQISPSLEDYSRLLLSLSNPFRRSFILVDALDEHFVNEDEENAMRLTFLDELLNLQQLGNSSGAFTLFFTSRENHVIQKRLTGYVRLDIRAADPDIESYLRSRVRDPTRFTFAEKVRDDNNLVNLIVGRVVEKAQGMLVIT